MRRRAPAYSPRYLAKVLALRPHLAPSEVVRVTVAHDESCALLAGRGQCNCEPDVGPLQGSN